MDFESPPDHTPLPDLKKAYSFADFCRECARSLQEQGITDEQEIRKKIRPYIQEKFDLAKRQLAEGMSRLQALREEHEKATPARGYDRFAGAREALANYQAQREDELQKKQDFENQVRAAEAERDTIQAAQAKLGFFTRLFNPSKAEELSSQVNKELQSLSQLRAGIQTCKSQIIQIDEEIERLTNILSSAPAPIPEESNAASAYEDFQKSYDQELEKLGQTLEPHALFFRAELHASQRLIPPHTIIDTIEDLDETDVDNLNDALDHIDLHVNNKQ